MIVFIVLLLLCAVIVAFEVTDGDGPYIGPFGSYDDWEAEMERRYVQPEFWEKNKP